MTTAGPWRVADARARASDALARASEHLPWRDVIVGALERERFAAAGLLAGGLAYRLFFWLVPFGLVVASLLSFWVEEDPAALEDVAQDFGLSGAAAQAATEAIEQEAHSRWYLLVAGVLMLAWFGGGAVRALYVSHAVAWRLPPPKVSRPFRAGWVFTGTLTALILVSAGTAFLREWAATPGLGLTVGLLVLLAGVHIWGSSLLPSRATHWRAFVPGAILVAVGTQAVHLFAVFYLAPKLGRSSALYGTLGAATVVLLWLFLIARLVVGAAFMNAALWERRHWREVEPPARSSHPDDVLGDDRRHDPSSPKEA